MEPYNPNKFKNGVPTRIPQRTWDEMTPQKRALYSDSPDVLKEIPSNAVEIKMPDSNVEVNQKESEEVEKLKAEIQELNENIDALKESNEDLKTALDLAVKENNSLKAKLNSKPEAEESKEQIESQGGNGQPEIDPYELQVPELKEWLKTKGIKFDNRIKDIEKLQKLIP